jgi:hypothetical protein
MLESLYLRNRKDISYFQTGFPGMDNAALTGCDNMGASIEDSGKLTGQA